MQNSFKTLDLEQDGTWLTVWFNEPERRNPLSSERAADLIALCNDLHQSNMRGVTFRGRGKVFCAGGDLSLFQQVLDGTLAQDALETISRDGAALFDAIANLPQVTLCHGHGAVMAGGLGLLSLCDIVITEPTCRFALSEVRLGLVAAQIAPFVMRRIGATHTRRLMITGAGFDGTEAHRIGLADFLTPATEFDHIEQSIKEDVLACAPAAVAASKALLSKLPSLSRDAQIDAAAQYFAQAANSSEGREGLRAFASKRNPIWAQEIT